MTLYSAIGSWLRFRRPLREYSSDIVVSAVGPSTLKTAPRGLPASSTACTNRSEMFSFIVALVEPVNAYGPVPRRYIFPFSCSSG